MRSNLWARNTIDKFISGDIAMNLDRVVMAFAGVMILISAALVHFFSPWWLLLTAFIGLNLLQASFTGFCPAAKFFQKLGIGSGPAFK
jgi:fatty acid desaturase